MPEIFDKAQRDLAKKCADPELCLHEFPMEDYIRALEEVAKAIVQFSAFANPHHTQEVEFRDAHKRLHDALAKVDWMRGDD